MDNKSWLGKWIEPKQQDVTEEPLFTMMDMFHGTKDLKQEPIEKRLHPPKYLQKKFILAKDKKVDSAKLWITSHGLYEARMNGKLATDAIFTPDYTSYQKILQYQEYDITNLLKEENSWQIILADGWYAGRVSMTGGSAQFGNRLAVLAEIEVSYADGTSETIGTDQLFYSTNGKFVYSDIFIGEKQDLRLEIQNDYNQEGTQAWEQVSEKDDSFENLVPQIGAQVKRKEALKPVSHWLEEDSLIVDFGQVIAGRIAFEAFLGDGEEIIVDHAEIVDCENKFFPNIVGRNKEQQDIFVGRGASDYFEPVFTFHGFRYVKISGQHQKINMDTIKAYVIYSDLTKSGYIKTSHKKINQLLSNIEWSQKGNMLSIPTDCPQRERLGWTGDIQIFANTATFFMDVETFLIRWLESVKSDQQSNGEIVDYSPVPKDYFTTRPPGRGNSSAGWGDAIIMVPWVLYQKYGNKDVLVSCYDAMVRWHNFSKESAAGEKTGSAKYIWDTKFHYGDWMFPSYMCKHGPFLTAKATKDLVGTAFLAHSSGQLAEIALLLGKEEDAKRFKEYEREVKQAFQEVFWKDEQLTADFQGSYVLALAFDLLEEEAKRKAQRRLCTLIEENNCRLDTGFVSVPYLMDVLDECGRFDLAEKILFQEEAPSWLYEINHGATTIWESWTAISPDGKIGKESFNHYALGCVGDWIIRTLSGLRCSKPGYENFTVAPHKLGNIDEVEMSYQTKFGTIKVDWQFKKDLHRLKITVPKSTKAQVVLPEVTPKAAGELMRIYPDGTYREDRQTFEVDFNCGDYNIEWRE